MFDEYSSVFFILFWSKKDKKKKQKHYLLGDFVVFTTRNFNFDM